MALQFDNKISLGHLITTVPMLVAAGIAWGALRAEQNTQALDISRTNASISAHDSRIRAVEIAQASQSSDLRSIQVGNARIEAQLEKLLERMGSK